MDSSIHAHVISQHIKDRVAFADKERAARELRPTAARPPARRLRLRLRLRRRRIAV